MHFSAHPIGGIIAEAVIASKRWFRVVAHAASLLKSHPTCGTARCPPGPDVPVAMN